MNEQLGSESPEKQWAQEFLSWNYRRMRAASARLPYRESSAVRKPSAAPAWTGFEEEAAWVPPPGIARSRTGSGPSRFDPQPVGKVLGVIRKSEEWKTPLSLGQIANQWESIVGETVAAHCEIESFFEGKLQVRADSTAWARQLRLLLPQIEKRIAEELGEGQVVQTVIHAPRPPSWKHGRYSVRGRGPRDTYG